MIEAGGVGPAWRDGGRFDVLGYAPRSAVHHDSANPLSSSFGTLEVGLLRGRS